MSTAAPLLAARPPTPGRGELAFRSVGGKTVVAAGLAASPLRLLEPRNHGCAAWVFLVTFGGGLVDGDRVDVDVDVGEGASALVGTQASTKVYRSPRGCSQRLAARVADGALFASIPDPVVCFAGARYAQRVDVDLAPGASLVLLDGYTCGRGARGERWALARYASRTSIARAGRRVAVDATRLEPAHGPIADRMGRTDAVLSLVAVGPRAAAVREAMLAETPAPRRGASTVVAASPLGGDGAIVRVASTRLEDAARALRPALAALARVLGDDPFARKW